MSKNKASKEQIEAVRVGLNTKQVVFDKAIKDTQEFKDAVKRLQDRYDTANKPRDLDVYNEMVLWHDAAERIKAGRYFSGWRGEPADKDIEAEMQRHLREQQNKKEQAAQDIQRVFRGHQGRKKFDKELVKKLASGGTRESLEQEKMLAQEKLQKGKWFSGLRSGPDEKAILAEVEAERERKAKIRQDRFALVEERRKQLAERNEEKRSQATAKREETTKLKVVASKAKGEQIKKSAEVARKNKPVIEYASSLSHNSTIYTIMSKSIEFAKVDSGFDKVMFMFSMKTILLGPDFQDFKARLAEKEQKAFMAAEKKLDADLVKLSEAIDDGIKNNTLDKPQNGIIRKCIVSIAKTVGLIVSLTVVIPGAFVSMGIQKVVGPNKVSTKLNLSLGLVLFSIKDFVDSKTKSSTVEEAMDKMVEDVDKNFGKQMSIIAKNYSHNGPSAEVTEEETREASQRLQGRKWFGSVRSKATEEEVANEVRVKKDQQQRESEAVEVANRFQDRFARIRSQGKTFAGRELARKAEESKDKGPTKQ